MNVVIIVTWMHLAWLFLPCICSSTQCDLFSKFSKSENISENRFRFKSDLAQALDYTLCKKSTIHQVTTMLAISKIVLFPGHNHLLTTGTDDLTLWLSLERQRGEGSSVPVVTRWLWPGNRTFLEVASMVVTWWRMAFFAQCTFHFLNQLLAHHFYNRCVIVMEINLIHLSLLGCSYFLRYCCKLRGFHSMCLIHNKYTTIFWKVKKTDVLWIWSHDINFILHVPLSRLGW